MSPGYTPYPDCSGSDSTGKLLRELDRALTELMALAPRTLTSGSRKMSALVRAYSCQMKA